MIGRGFTILVILFLGISCSEMSGSDSAADSRVDGRELTPRDYKNLDVISLFVGGEKVEFLENPATREILARKYGIRLDAIKAGSVEMVRELDVKGKDALWPSNDIAVEFFTMRGGRSVKDDIMFNSPIVVYTGWNIANALIQQGYVQKQGETYYIVRFPDLLKEIDAGKTWKDLGLNFYGNVSIRCTDPTRSNSGNMFCGLLANLLNGGEVVDQDDLDTVGPKVKEFFSRLGMMEHSSGDIFRKFIATGIQNSMVVGYENQIVEFMLAHPESRQAIQSSVCILYPQPTVWSSHPVIALNDQGKKLIEALSDPEIQELAWKEHGFRSGLMGVTQNVSDLGIASIPQNIESVMPLPTAPAMDELVELLNR